MVKKAHKMSQSAKICVEKWQAYFKYNIDQYHQYHLFVLSRQWEDDEEDMLIKTLNKVPLQFNKLATLINTLLGEQQQNTPQIEVAPLSNCDEETCRLREIIVKDRMMSTDAKMIYQIAAAQAFTGGFGAYIVDTDYVSNRSFDQDIIYRPVKDATRCYWDPAAEDISKTDGMFAGYITRMSRKKFGSIYGKELEKNILKDVGTTQSKEQIALTVQPSSTENPFTWNDEEAVTIIDHYVRKYEKDRLFKLSNGEAVNMAEMDELVEKSKEINAQHQARENQLRGMEGVEQAAGMPFEIQEMTEVEAEVEDIETMMLWHNGQPVRIEEELETKKSKIFHYKIAGDYILDKSEFPSEDLPIIFVDQHSFYDKSGKQICRPFVIDAVDAQRFINYLGTQIAYLLKISRYDQFIGSKKNVQSNDTAAQWRDPITIKGMLTYDESPSGAKPEQLRPPEISQSLIQQYQRAIEDLYTSTGLYPSRLGQQGNEISGDAIDARTRQGSYSTYVAFNSINRAITAGGKIVNQMIPRVYDSERVLSLMTPDRGRQNITINQQVDEYGEKIKNDLTKGSFEVRLQAGPSYEGQKAQALESLNIVLKANPQLLNLIADLYAENLPLTNTIEIKNRLKTIVPPEILQAGKSGEMPQKAQQPNPQDQTVMAEIQFKQQQIEIKKAELQIKMQEQQAKTEQAAMELEMKKLELAAELEEQKLRYLAETDRTRSDNAISHADNITKLLTHKIA